MGPIRGRPGIPAVPLIVEGSLGHSRVEVPHFHFASVNQACGLLPGDSRLRNRNWKATVRRHF